MRIILVDTIDGPKIMANGLEWQRVFKMATGSDSIPVAGLGMLLERIAKKSRDNKKIDAAVEISYGGSAGD